MLRIVQCFGKHCSYYLQGESRSSTNTWVRTYDASFETTRCVNVCVVSSAVRFSPKFTAPQIRQKDVRTNLRCCPAQVSNPGHWRTASFAKFVFRTLHRASFLQDDSSAKHSKTNSHSCVSAQLPVLTCAHPAVHGIQIIDHMQLSCDTRASFFGHGVNHIILS
jgi:hypothetical protein